MTVLIAFKFVFLLTIIPSGLANPDKVHINKGRNAVPNSHPWLLTLAYMSDPGCAANLIRVPYLDGSSDIAVTAAHCFSLEDKTASFDPCLDDEFRTGHYEAIAGNHDQSMIDPGEVRVKVVNGKCHPTYNSDHVSDIALVKLETPIKFSSTIQPIDLPKSDEDLPGGTLCTIAGWGATEQKPDEHGVLQDVNEARILQEAEIRIEADSVCSSLSDSFKGNVQICDAISSDPFTLEGDSGSALVCDGGSGKKLFGVLAAGIANREGKYKLDTFTEVRRFVHWIEETVTDLRK